MCKFSFYFKGFGTTISSLSNFNTMRSSPKITCYGSEVHFSQCTYKAVSLWRDPNLCGNDLIQLHCGYGKYHIHLRVRVPHTHTYRHTHFCMYMYVCVYVRCIIQLVIFQTTCSSLTILFSHRVQLCRRNN